MGFLNEQNECFKNLDLFNLLYMYGCSQGYSALRDLGVASDSLKL